MSWQDSLTFDVCVGDLECISQYSTILFKKSLFDDEAPLIVSNINKIYIIVNRVSIHICLITVQLFTVRE